MAFVIIDREIVLKKSICVYGCHLKEARWDGRFWNLVFMMNKL